MDIKSTVKLNNGIEMPMLGLGVYQLRSGEEAQNAILCALERGYRLIDTAKIYGNEKDVGIAIKKSKIPREEIFVTTKLWQTDHGFVSTIRSCVASLKNLDLTYIDLYLIHWPVRDLNKETWKAMETLYSEGKCGAIGVSNFTIENLNELLDSAKINPSVNQVEFSPFLYQKNLHDFCSSNGIQLESYCPLTRGEKFNNPDLMKISSKYIKSPAQILIRWALQHNLVTIPKSSKKERIFENSDVFDFFIKSEDMKVLDSLNENFRTCWNPSEIIH